MFAGLIAKNSLATPIDSASTETQFSRAPKAA